MYPLKKGKDSGLVSGDPVPWDVGKRAGCADQLRVPRRRINSCVGITGLFDLASFETDYGWSLRTIDDHVKILGTEMVVVVGLFTKK